MFSIAAPKWDCSLWPFKTYKSLPPSFRPDALVTYSEAVDLCSYCGGILPEPKSEQENTELVEFVQQEMDYPPWATPIWLGITDLDMEGSKPIQAEFMTKHVSSMIPSAKPTVPPVAITIFSLKVVLF